ncbi:MAG: GTPase [Phycisphaerales bacterium]
MTRAGGEAPCTWWWSTAPRAGAIAVAHVAGPAPAVDALLRAMTGAQAPTTGALAWRRLGAVDDGVVARVAATHALVMPHGGTRIRARLETLAAAAGARVADGAAPEDTFPEAADALEAHALAAIARAASPLAIDLLAAQPARWRAHGAPGAATDRDRRLRRLIDPPRIAIVGPANAGKSSLLNALAGRTVAIAHDRAGTTRDAVAARVDLAGLVVDCFDTPGARPDADAVERAAAALAARAIEHADLLLHLSAPGLGWDAPAAPERIPRLRVLAQCDRAEAERCAERAQAALRVSALRGEGLPALAARVRDLLVPPQELADGAPWRFAEGLPGPAGA